MNNKTKEYQAIWQIGNMKEEVTVLYEGVYVSLCELSNGSTKTLQNNKLTPIHLIDLTPMNVIDYGQYDDDTRITCKDDLFKDSVIIILPIGTVHIEESEDSIGIDKVTF